MSRIAKKPVMLPTNVEVTTDGSFLSVKGPKGRLEKKIFHKLDIVREDRKIYLKPKATDRHTFAMWGTEAAHMLNMVKGVSDGFEKILELEGIGYKAVLKGNLIELSVGFNKPIQIDQPEGIAFRVEKNAIFINGIDKQLVGQTAAKIRKIRPPEPYKGKGIRYRGEIIRKKAGKKAVSTG